MNKIKGDNIRCLNTIPSMYADGRVEVWMNDSTVSNVVYHTSQPYMIRVEELLKLLRGKTFGLEKKRKYEYLNLDDSLTCANCGASNSSVAGTEVIVSDTGAKFDIWLCRKCRETDYGEAN